MRRGYEHAYIRARVLFFQTWHKWQPGMETVGEGFFIFAKKIKMAI